MDSRHHQLGFKTPIQEWRKYNRLLPELEKIQISRWIKLDTQLKKIEIHAGSFRNGIRYAAVRIFGKNPIHSRQKLK